MNYSIKNHSNIFTRPLLLIALALLCPFLLLAQVRKWTFKECIEYAFKNNIALNQQTLTAEITKVNYKQSKENLWPNLNFTDVHEFSFGNTVNSNTYQVNHQNTISNDPSLISTIVLFNGFRYKNLVKETRLSYEASTLDVVTQKNNLALNVAAAYTQVLFSYDAIAIAQRQVDADSVQIVKTDKYVSVGQLSESALLQIEAQLATDKSSKVNAQNQLALANVQLEQLMELPITPDFLIERPEQNKIVPNINTTSADIYKIAESILPDVKSAEFKTHVSETDLEVNKAALLPSLNINAGLTSAYYSPLSPRTSYQTVYQNETIGYLQSNPSESVIGSVPVTTTTSKSYPFFHQFGDNFSQFISLSLTVPIFNNYKARNNLRLSKIAVENARLNEQAVKNTLRRNVEQAYTDQVAAAKNYIATLDQLNSETRAYTDMQKKFNTGLSSATDFLIEQNNYYKAILANVQAKYEYIFKTKVIDFYTGTPLTQ